MYWQSIQQLFTYFSLDQYSGPPTDTAIPIAALLAASHLNIRFIDTPACVLSPCKLCLWPIYWVQHNKTNELPAGYLPAVVALNCSWPYALKHPVGESIKRISQLGSLKCHIIISCRSSSLYCVFPRWPLLHWTLARVVCHSKFKSNSPSFGLNLKVHSKNFVGF